ncbi:MAG: glycoside hydrolase family 57 protein [bacterium]|nr:glycoside hydrolase family 57 protein [bacterium]
MKSINLYLHVHQPYRVRDYTIFDVGTEHNYFDAPDGDRRNNADIIRKVAEKSYRPTNELLLELLESHPEFKLSLSISGVVLDQLADYAPDVLESFKKLVDTGQVELVGETFYHSLSFFYSKAEFIEQVKSHRRKLGEIFGVTPTAFRNTELAYNNELAMWADAAGYETILAEGWDPVLGWRSPNYVYRPVQTKNIKLLLKNYRLSDDIAFRFGNKNWEGWPMTADKFVHWLNSSGEADIFNLFMDYETFGEHQWDDTGIFDFMRHLPGAWLADPNHKFMTVTEASKEFESKDFIDMHNTVTWADTERDLSAWLGNAMQQEAINAVFGLEKAIKATEDKQLLHDWRRLTTSDHFYYMCTKWFNDGDIHAYFSPYETPYQAFITYMNAWHDLKSRLMEVS